MSVSDLDKESGDAKLLIPKLLNKLDGVDTTTVADITTNSNRIKKSPRLNHGCGDITVGGKNHANKEIQKIRSDAPLEGDDGDNFYDILNSECPEGEQTATLLDQVMELRAELEARVAELSTFKAELREVSQLLSVDPFAAVQSASGSISGQIDSEAPNIDELN